MHRTFNMGLGMVLAVSKDASETILEFLAVKNSGAQIIGHVHDDGHKVTHMNSEVLFQHY
jgi:phosphoribosylaminoimidazole (AIR) synthetase